MERVYAALMGLCLAAFLARVLGQILVGLYKPAYLPPWKEWYSGILPYPWLLLSQMLILLLMSLMTYDAWMGAGVFHVSTGRSASWVRGFSWIYLTSMVLRYVLTMAFQPHRRWFKGTIPIWFHMVLACFLCLASAPRPAGP